VKTPRFDISIEVPYKNVTRDVIGITSLTPYDHVIHLLAEKIDVRPTASGKCTLSSGHPRTAQDALEMQRHQRCRATERAPEQGQKC
jgi:hypothetical protein